MKENKSILAFGILLICLFVSLFIIFQFYKKDTSLKCYDFSYKDILFDINAELNNTFIMVEDTSRLLPISLSNDSDYIFAINDITNDEYFLIINNIKQEEYINLKNYVESYNELNIDNELKITEDNSYTYLVKSNKNKGTISGIIRSYISCEKRD